MHYYSLHSADQKADFSEALLSSLAPDGGLYMPSSLPRFDANDLIRLGSMSFADCAAALARFYVDDNFDNAAIQNICQDAYNFPLPLKTFSGYTLDPALVEPAESDFILELFHGPTLAFKDFAARFMARCVSHLLSQSGAQRTVLVATSGDTGGAVGHAFLDQPGIDVFILYPEGRVSAVQEHQLTGMGENSNVTAIAVEGTFDDCQALVKQAFGDTSMSQSFDLMSANSINVGRVIPQSFYYFWTSNQIKAAYPHRPVVYSVPSGNLGNLTGGLIAYRMGAPIDHFVVGNNANDAFVDYLHTGTYTPRQTVPTLSNAMDIGRPNNFPRILALFDGDYDQITNLVSGWSFTDEDTERHIRTVFRNTGYLMCPHTAVGHLAMQAYAARQSKDLTEISVSTAHPAKFLSDVERIIHQNIDIPPALQDCIDAPSHKKVIPATLEALSTVMSGATA